MLGKTFPKTLVWFRGFVSAYDELLYFNSKHFKVNQTPKQSNTVFPRIEKSAVMLGLGKFVMGPLMCVWNGWSAIAARLQLRWCISCTFLAISLLISKIFQQEFLESLGILRKLPEFCNQWSCIESDLHKRRGFRLDRLGQIQPQPNETQGEARANEKYIVFTSGLQTHFQITHIYSLMFAVFWRADEENATLFQGRQTKPLISEHFGLDVIGSGQGKVLSQLNQLRCFPNGTLFSI